MNICLIKGDEKMAVLNSRLKANAHKECIKEFLTKMGVDLDEKYMKKIECSFDSEKLLELHVEFMVAIVDGLPKNKLHEVVIKVFDGEGSK